MKQEVAEQWAAALRSGKYKQTVQRLRDTQGFCCLGVLCDISGIAEWYPIGKESWYGDATEQSPVALPTIVREWAGLRTRLADREGHKDMALSQLNDRGYTFEDIADIIDAEWPEL